MADPRSMTGSKYEVSRTDPSGFTPATRKLYHLIEDNPNVGPAQRQANRMGQGVMSSYLSLGLPVDYEGLATAYSMKYGQKATEKLMSALPYMSQSDLVGVIQDMGQAGDEYVGMQTRERNTYKRAGADKYERGE